METTHRTSGRNNLINPGFFLASMRREIALLLGEEPPPVHAEDDPQEASKMLFISGPGLRSAIVAVCLEYGLPPAEVARMSIVMEDEPDSPSAALFALVRSAAHVMYDAGAEISPGQWTVNKLLRGRLMGALDSLQAEISGVCATEATNMNAGKPPPDGGTSQRHRLLMDTGEGRALDYAFGSGPTAVLLANPDAMAAIATGLSRVPQARRATASCEIIRHLIASRHERPKLDDLVVMIDIIAAIYGD